MHDRHPDGEVIASPGDHAGDFLLWDADIDADDRSVLTVAPCVRAGSPDAWFVVLEEGNGAERTCTLVAFATPHLATGTVVTDPVFFHMPVRSDEQVGAIRWWPEDAVVDQVFVGREWRRSHLATVLIYSASAYHQHHGWPGRLHSDGRRTMLGEALVAEFRHPGRIARLDKLLSPMDPESRV